jgi:diguanylate cyclase (GGDEF)-like protein/PAS domain S-box-containing protein
VFVFGDGEADVLSKTGKSKKPINQKSSGVEGGRARINRSLDTSVIQRKVKTSGISGLTKIEQELQLRSFLLDSCTDAISLHDLDGNFLYVNEAYCKSVGYTRGKLMKLKVTQFSSADSAACFPERIRKVLDKGVATFESTHIRKDGTAFPVEVHARGVEQDGKKLVLGVVRDITERKNAEEELRLNAHILNNTTDAIMVHDFAGNFVFANQTACKSLGYTREEFMKMNLSQVDDKYTSGSREEQRGLMKQGPVFFETAHRHKNGTLVTVEVNCRVIESGGKKLILGVMRDITERKRAEEESHLRVGLLDSTTDSIFARDVEGKILYANKSSWETRGYTEEEFLKANIKDLMVPEEIVGLAQRTSAMLEKGSSIFESTHLRKDGSRFPVEVFANLLNIKGKPIFLTVIRDITERKKVEEELQLKSQLLDSATDSIYLHDFEGRLLFVNEVAYKSLGYTREELLGMTLRQLDTTENARLYPQRMQELLERGNLIFEAVHIAKDGTEIAVEVHDRIIESGGKKLILGVIRDITDRKIAEEELKFRSQLLDSATDSIVVHDLKGNISYVNEAACHLFGYTRDELLNISFHRLHLPSPTTYESRGQELAQRITEKGSVTFETIDIRKDGSMIPVEVHDRIIELEGEKYMIGVIRDISERKTMEDYIKQLAYHDPLTHLPNRTLLSDRFSLAEAHAFRYKHPLAVMVMDLDKFKDVNDSLGHGIGDKLLIEVGSRLASAVRKTDTVARLGGDEFVVLLAETNGEEDAMNVAQKIIDIVKEPLVLEKHELTITTSIGIALYPDDGHDFETLVKHADLAMYRVKQQGRNNCLHYTRDVDTVAPEK